MLVHVVVKVFAEKVYYLSFALADLNNAGYETSKDLLYLPLFEDTECRVNDVVNHIEMPGGHPLFITTCAVLRRERRENLQLADFNGVYCDDPLFEVQRCRQSVTAHEVMSAVALSVKRPSIHASVRKIAG